MQGKRSFWGRLCTYAVLFSMLLAMAGNPLVARAGTTGILEGTITDSASGKPIAGAKVVAVSGSGTFSGTTDAHGFYAIMALLPDTYTVRVSAKGYSDLAVAGVFVQQDDIVRFDQKLQSENLKTIANVSARSRSDLVQPYNGSDVYNVSGQQLEAATGGTDTHETEYQYIDTVPGVVGNGGYGVGQPSIRGGFSDVDTGFELDGVPISDREVGFFGTNLTDIGVGNVEVVTGGLTPADAANGTGIINQVSKVGTYPGYFQISSGITDSEFNHYERAELSGATPNGRWSWFISNDAANSQNYYWVGNQQLNGSTYTLLGTPGSSIAGYPGGISFANAGYIYTRDVMGNFHYRPDPRDDFQLLELNTYFNDQGTWGIVTPINNPAIGVAECPGATGNAYTASNGTGGVAPNGQPCPLGLYSYDLPSGAGNFAGHNSNVFKLQWNHTINATSSFQVHVAEFYNKYEFNQPYSDPNQAIYNSEWTGTGCPTYPIANGTPVGNFGAQWYDMCLFNLSDSYEERSSHDYYANADYTWSPNENLTLKVGANYEYDDQIQYTDYLNFFNATTAVQEASGTDPDIGCRGAPGTYPCINQLSDDPQHSPSFWGQLSWNIGKFTLQPGLNYTREYYGFPAYVGGGLNSGFIAPSLAGTYRINNANVIRYSFAESGSFPGSVFVYELNNPTFDPGINGASSIEPAINRMTDLGYEHQFNSLTSLRFTAYTRNTDNYPSFYTPFLGYKPGTNEWLPAPTYLVDNLRIRQFGGELGINHNDPRPTGVGWWLAESYCNCWTQISDYTFGHSSYFNGPLQAYFTNQGIYLRSESTPLFATTLTADLHTAGWHLEPYFYWTFDNFYNAGGCMPLNTAGTAFQTPGQNTVPVYCSQQSILTNPGAPTPIYKTVNPVLAPEGIGMGYIYMNASVFKDINKTWRVGLWASNLTNQQHGTTPSCFNYGSGCWPYGPQSGTIGKPNGWDYQSFTNGAPRLIEVFATARFAP